MKKALITGISGFVGSHLAEELLKNNFEVYGFAHPEQRQDNLENIKDKIKLTNINLLEKELLEKHMVGSTFDYVFHLAAFSSAASSFENERKTLENNIFGQLNLLESLVKSKSEARILIVGSCDEYGNVSKKSLPINEDVPLSPASPYAVSKVTQDVMGLQFFLNYNLKIIRVRPFNHIGPRQAKNFVVPTFASQIVLSELGKNKEIKVGNLSAKRDFTDVRDMVCAYILALERGEVGEVYNIGSGKSYIIEDILNKLLSFSRVKVKVVQDKKLFRKTDIDEIYCDFSKFKKQTNWEPHIPIEKTLSDTIDYERTMLNK